jgi:hypothetical protein
MQGQVTPQLGVEGDREDVPVANRDGVAIHLSEHLHAFPDLLHPWSPDKYGIERGALEREFGLEGRQLATERVATHLDVEYTEMIPVQHDHSRTGAKDRLAAPDEVDERLTKPLTLHPESNSRGLAAWNDQGFDALEIIRRADLTDFDVKASETLRVRLEAALKGQNADDHQPRFWSSPPFS